MKPSRMLITQFSTDEGGTNTAARMTWPCATLSRSVGRGTNTAARTTCTHRQVLIFEKSKPATESTSLPSHNLPLNVTYTSTQRLLLTIHHNK